MNLIADEFNDLINEFGDRCQWRRAFVCPCGSEGSGSADPSCPSCAGAGQLWDDPVACVVAGAGSNASRRWSQFGMSAEGDKVVSIGSDSPAYAIGPYDRLLMTDQTEPFSMRIQPGVNDRIRFPVVSVAKVLAFDADRNLLVLPLPAVDDVGGLTWPDGAPAGQYSIAGRRRVEFYTFTNQPFDRPHELGEPLPRRIVLRRFDLYERSL